MGSFDPNAPGITATDDEAIAKSHGLTYWNDELGQYTAPPAEADETASIEAAEQQADVEGNSPVDNPDSSQQ